MQATKIKGRRREGATRRAAQRTRKDGACRGARAGQTAAQDAGEVSYLAWSLGLPVRGASGSGSSSGWTDDIHLKFT